MKKYISVLLIICMLSALCACGTDEKGKTELILADSTGKGAAGQLFNEYLAKRVEELTGGALTVNYHPNGELGGDADLIRQMQAGDIDLVLCQMAPLVSFIPETAVFDLPMVFSKYDGERIDRVLNGDGKFHEKIAGAYESAGFKLLGFLQNATYRLTTANVPLNTVEDFARLQIRTMENKNHMAFWSAIGAEPTPLAWGEVYLSLQSGTIDAQENAADTCVGANFNEVQKYLACTNHILYLNQICMNKAAYDSLPEELQSALRAAVSDAIAYMRPQLADIDAESKKKLEKGGMTVIEYNDTFYDSILALDGVKALYEKINGEVNGLGDLLAEELHEVRNQE